MLSAVYSSVPSTYIFAITIVSELVVMIPVFVYGIY